ncbi:hypothetical protein GE09DRAFT_1283111 [Coniochaeta sp. 2T2.1]|nr:hypothetical protein GE09DRAFT_1283111 [Coniochaeta sp. 2T2.1]
MAISKEHGAAFPEDDRDDNSFVTALLEYESGSSGPGPSPYKRLPLSFNIYYKQWFSSMYQIGEHENQPLFTIQRHGAWGHDRPMIVLHEGADPKGHVVGTVTKEGLMKHDTVIELPRQGSEGGTIREPFVSDVSMTLKNSRFRFSFDVGLRGKETRRETFEWRISKAVEVRALDSMAFGWKLVRLGPDGDQPTGGRGGPRGARDVGEASDGKEVVAAWSENSGLTLSKIAKFHFLGAGATGEFGDDWALMAALSAFRLWKFTSGSISVRP